MRDFFTEEITQIREMVSRDPSYSELSDEQLKDRINAMLELRDRKSTRLNSSHSRKSRMPSSA